MKVEVLLKRSAVIFVTVLFAGIFSQVLAQEPAAEESIKVGVEAPPFRLQSLKGDTISLADYLGKYVVIHLAASW